MTPDPSRSPADGAVTTWPPTACVGVCLEFVSSKARGEPDLFRQAAAWLEANPDVELVSVDVLPGWFGEDKKFLRLMVLPAEP